MGLGLRFFNSSGGSNEPRIVEIAVNISTDQHNDSGLEVVAGRGDAAATFQRLGFQRINKFAAKTRPVTQRRHQHLSQIARVDHDALDADGDQLADVVLNQRRATHDN